MRKLFVASFAIAAAATAFGQTGDISSFAPASFFDVFVSVSNSNLTYTVSLGSAPTMTFGGNTYDIDDIFAFYTLQENSDQSTSIGATGSDQNGWTFESKKSNFAGWVDKGHGQPGNNALVPGGSSLAFTYSALSDPDFLYGFHFTYNLVGSNTTQTGYFKGQGNPGLPGGGPNFTPAPGALVPFAIGAIGLLRRRISRA